MADSPLQKAPLNLTSVYNLKALGDNPILFHDTVLPVADVSQFYERDLLVPRTVSTTAAIGVNNAQIGLGISAPETGWLLYGCSANFTLAAADGGFTSTLLLRMLLGGASAVGLATKVDQVAAGVLLGRFVEFWFPRPFLMMPGDRLEAFFQTSSVLTVASNLNLIAAAAVLQ